MITQLDPITVFRQFGFREQGKALNHVIGRCPFCGKDSHFYINIATNNRMWDCKSCARSGGYKKFLEQLVEIGIKEFTPVLAKQLSENRGIKESTFKQVKTGYLPVANVFILPVFGHDGKTILNIKIFDYESMKNTAGGVAAVYGLWLVPDAVSKYECVYIAEGEWDTLVLLECKIPNAIVLGAPGAGTFRTDILPYIAGKKTYLLYDNDLAGENGKAKAARILGGVTGDIHVIDWPEGLKKGYDVRDLYNENSHDVKKTLAYLHEHCKQYDMLASPVTPVQDGVAGPSVPVQEVYNVFQKHLHLPDTDVLDVVFGSVLGNKIEGDPIWMFIVGPPGSTKTVPLHALKGCPRIASWTGITPHVLISGANLGGNDPSLIPQLDGCIWVDTDFTSILGLPYAEQNEIFSILRPAFDGACSKPFGNGMRRSYKSRFGILAAVTPIIEQYIEEHSAAGERFLRWDNCLPKSLVVRKKYVDKAWENSGKEPEITAEFNNMAKRVLLAEYKDEVKISGEMKDKIIGLSQWISVLRGVVTRDKFGNRDVTFCSFAELSTRIAKQLKKLAIGIAWFRHEKNVDEDIYRVLTTVAKSSVQTRYNSTIRAIYVDGAQSQGEIQPLVGLPSNTVKFVLENLMTLGAIEKGEGGTTPKWRIKKDLRDIMDLCNIYQMKKEG